VPKLKFEKLICLSRTAESKFYADFHNRQLKYEIRYTRGAQYSTSIWLNNALILPDGSLQCEDRFLNFFSYFLAPFSQQLF
jgi:hypothetical protein